MPPRLLSIERRSASEARERLRLPWQCLLRAGRHWTSEVRKGSPISSLHNGLTCHQLNNGCSAWRGLERKVVRVPFVSCRSSISLPSSWSFSSVLGLVEQLGKLEDGHVMTWERGKHVRRWRRRLGWFPGFQAPCSVVGLEKKKHGEALTGPQLGKPRKSIAEADVGLNGWFEGLTRLACLCGLRKQLGEAPDGSRACQAGDTPFSGRCQPS